MLRPKTESVSQRKKVTIKDSLTDLMGEVYRVTNPQTDSDVHRSAEKLIERINNIVEAHKRADDIAQAYSASFNFAEKLKVAKEIKKIIEEIRNVVKRVGKSRMPNGSSKIEKEFHEAVIGVLDRALIADYEELGSNFFEA